jgi:hypothetical protein
MSSPLAIAGVTAVLQYYFYQMYVSVADNFSSSVTVSCLAPDQIQNQIVSLKADSENQVNLFLHQVTHNAAWRNSDFASMSSGGTQRLSNPPLALNLHYLLTVYGSDYLQSEALMGYALMMLHQAPVLTREDIANALALLNPPSPTPPPYPGNVYKYIGSAGLADQIEMIKITPESMGREEMAWLWTALKADYRLTFPFQVSVVLLQPVEPTSFALPVLRTVISPSPIPPPQISAIVLPPNQVGAQLTDTVYVTGEFLLGASRVAFSNASYGAQLTALADDATDTSLNFAFPPDAAGEFPAGVYQFTVQFMDSTNTIVLQETNPLPLAICPSLPPSQTAASAPSGSGTMVTLSNFSPKIYEKQTVALALSTVTLPLVSVSATAQPFTNLPASLQFLFDTGLPTGEKLLARLEVDGVSSIVTADLSVFPPVFTGPWVTL